MRFRKIKATKGGKIHPSLNWINITPQKGNFTFGYYDRNPFSHDNRYHLAIKFGQQKRIPEPGEKAMVGIIEISSKKFIPIAETEAWCHQQGSMTQWLPNNPKQFIFNDFISVANSGNDRWKPISRVFNIHGDHIKDYDYPVYVLSHDGNYAATLNFSRIPRRGYSYARAPKPEDQKLPDVANEGLFLMDLKTGKRRLILDYRTILEDKNGPIQQSKRLRDQFGTFYHWMNHAGFNVDDSRVMILHRYKKRGFSWKTDLWSCNLDGSDAECTFSNEWWSKWHVSHQLWGRYPREILVDGKLSRFSYPKYWVFNEESGPEKPRLVSKGTKYAGHLNFSPDFRCLLGDTYSQSQTQYLGITKLPSKNTKIIGTFYHSMKLKGDYRCDLHPRWSADGKFISVDTVHYGERKILILTSDQISGL